MDELVIAARCWGRAGETGLGAGIVNPAKHHRSVDPPKTCHRGYCMQADVCVVCVCVRVCAHRHVRMRLSEHARLCRQSAHRGSNEGH
eukprot:1150011-Pelagomonas_calceolata.AAC.3